MLKNDKLTYTEENMIGILESYLEETLLNEKDEDLSKKQKTYKSVLYATAKEKFGHSNIKDLNKNQKAELFKAVDKKWKTDDEKAKSKKLRESLINDFDSGKILNENYEFESNSVLNINEDYIDNLKNLKEEELIATHNKLITESKTKYIYEKIVNKNLKEQNVEFITELKDTKIYSLILESIAEFNNK